MTRFAFPFALTVALVLATSSAHAITANLAPRGVASQSSTRIGSGGNEARFAIDSVTDGNFGKGSVTHTLTLPNQSWEVALENPGVLNQVTLHNRSDCCGNRLSNFRVSVMSGAATTFTDDFFATGSVPQGGSFDIALPNVPGDTVKVELLGGAARVLSLAEVQVFGTAEAPNGINLARLGVAAQTSTRGGTGNNTASGGNLADYAIDGNTNGAFGVGSVTHTNSEAQPAWVVDLIGTPNIDNIVVHERTDGCCVNRLANGVVAVLDESMNPLHVAPFTAVSNSTNELHVPVPFGTRGRFVAIQLDDTGSNRTLEMAEVQVFGGDLLNVARNPLAVATQSSTRAAGGAAERAIDGITSGFFGDNSVTHTNNQDDPFWNLDLGEPFNIEEIVLHNRTDCCTERLSNFVLTVTDEAGLETFSFIGGATNGVSDIRIPIGGFARGQNIRIDLPGTGRILSLAEVQVFGSAPVPEPATAAMALFGLFGLSRATRRRRVV